MNVLTSYLENLYYRGQRAFWELKNDDGAGVVEIALIIIVIIALVVIFRDEMKSLVEEIFSRINKESKSV